jgi:hypothetical protein
LDNEHILALYHDLFLNFFSQALIGFERSNETNDRVIQIMAVIA